MISNDKSIIAAEVYVIWNDRILTLKRPISKLFLAEFSNQHAIEPAFINEKNVP